MGTHKDGGLVSRTVREALGTLVSPQVAGQLIGRALAVAGLEQVPETGRAVADWIGGALRREIESTVGDDAAELVAAQLAPIVARAATGSQPQIEASGRHPVPIPTPPSSHRTAFGSDKPTGVVNAPQQLRAGELLNTARIQLSPRELATLRAQEDGGYTARPHSPEQLAVSMPRRRVLTASSARDAVDALQRYLGDAAQVEQVLDLVGLLDALEEPNVVEPIVLLDCQRPTVHATSIAAIGEDLPRGTTIMLWGASESTWRELDRDRERAPGCRWVRCSQEATTDDVGSLCAMLLG